MTNKNIIVILLIGFVIGFAVSYFVFLPANTEESYQRQNDSLLSSNKVLMDSITSINTYILTLEEQNSFLSADTNHIKKIYVEKYDSIIHLPVSRKVDFLSKRLPKPINNR